MANTGWALVADGTCRATRDKTLGLTLIYRIICEMNASSRLTYLEFSKPPVLGHPICDKGPPYEQDKHVAADHCFAGIPGTQGVILQCNKPGASNATLRGWTNKAPPKANELLDKAKMRDGAKLSTFTTFPPTFPFPPTGAKKMATLYIQCPYDIQGTFASALKSLPAMIDGVVSGATKSLPVPLHLNMGTTLQQTRGLYTSGPPTEPDPPNSFDVLRHTKNDSADSGAWIQRQKWSNGVIIMQGASAMGMTAWMAAGGKPKFTARASWLFITTNDLREAMYRQGAQMTGITSSILAPGFIPAEQCPRAPLAQHEGDGPDPFWDPVKFDDWSSVNFPTVMRTSWFDMFQKGGLRAAKEVYEKARCFDGHGCSNTLLVDALGHAGLYGIPKGKGSFPYNTTAQSLVLGYEQALAALLLFTFQGATDDKIARGLNVFWAGLTQLIPDKIVFVLGSGGNYLTGFNLWPQFQNRSVFLGPHGALTAVSPSSGEVSYVYDPSKPAPTYGGWLFENSNPNGEGCVDQSPLGARADVLQFDGEPLEEDLAICGEISASLLVASSANDTDFIVRLVDQYPSGERYQVAEGIIRMRWRGRVSEPVAMEPGQTYRVEIDMWSACWIFKAGHRLGVDVTSSSSFMFLPNPNTGLPLEPDGIWPGGGEYYKGKNITATNHVVFGPSKLTLPVVKVSDLPRINPLILPVPAAPPADEELIRMGEQAAMEYVI